MSHRAGPWRPCVCLCVQKGRVRGLSCSKRGATCLFWKHSSYPALWSHSHQKGSSSLLPHPVRNLREGDDSFLMRVGSKACAVRMVRGLALEYYTWNWLLREVSTRFSPAVWGGSVFIVRIYMAWVLQPQLINVAVVINKWSTSPMKSHSCIVASRRRQRLCAHRRAFYGGIAGKSLWLDHGLHLEWELTVALGHYSESGVRASPHSWHKYDPKCIIQISLGSLRSWSNQTS